MRLQYCDIHTIISLNDDIPHEERSETNDVRFYVIREGDVLIVFFGAFHTADDLQRACDSLPPAAYGLYGEARTISIIGFGIAPNFPSLYPNIEMSPWCWLAEHPDSVLSQHSSNAYINRPVPPEERIKIFNLLCQIDDIN